jgi:ribosomal protein S12 methylthiotransferase accessory factor YcaO
MGQRPRTTGRVECVPTTSINRWLAETCPGASLPIDVAIRGKLIEHLIRRLRPAGVTPCKKLRGREAVTAGILSRYGGTA